MQGHRDPSRRLYLIPSSPSTSPLPNISLPSSLRLTCHLAHTPIPESPPILVDVLSSSPIPSPTIFASLPVDAALWHRHVSDINSKNYITCPPLHHRSSSWFTLPSTLSWHLFYMHSSKTDLQAYIPTKSSTSTSCSFQILHSDVWGPAHVPSLILY